MTSHESVPVLGIRLRKDGEHTVVDAEIGGTWIEVIRERTDGEFCHIIEPSGMYSRYYANPGDRQYDPMVAPCDDAEFGTRP
jgi:hypothetical protein